MSALSFYDNIKQHAYSLSKRAHLPTIELRNFNNAKKMELISKYGAQASVVLDLAAGKGGHLPKWAAQRCLKILHLVDASGASIEEAKRRYDESYAQKFISQGTSVTFQAANMCTPFAYPAVAGLCDVVSCQFALHYAFKTEADANFTIRMISHTLRSGGYFLCTVPHADRVREFRDNSVCTIKWTGPKSYIFTLSGAVEECEEYLVPPKQLIEICARFGLELVERIEFYKDAQRSETLQWYEREVVSLYTAYAFIKK